MTDADLDQLVRRALAAGNFFVIRGDQIDLETRSAEPVPWELFNQQLLDPAMTRQSVELASWLLKFQPPQSDTDDTNSSQPLLVVRHDAATAQLYVTREILSYAHEPYSKQENVILTREVQRNRPELVGIIDLKSADDASIEYELREYLRLALTGLSRLPITSVESPHPAYSMGWLGYLPQSPPAYISESTRPLSDPAALVAQAFDTETNLSIESPAALLELALRAADPTDVPHLVQAVIASGRDPNNVAAALRTMFHQLALSPYTTLVARLMEFMHQLAESDALGSERVVDIVGFMLRHLVRHVTAFDLEKFHSFGANYPDALFLEELLAYFLPAADREPELFQPATAAHDASQAVRFRRRALRQAIMARHELEGLPVPDAPTSPGELARVMPVSLPRIPAKQVAERGTRKRRLFVDRPTSTFVDEMLKSANLNAIWKTAIDDLRDPRELQELGAATFLDRPLGRRKFPGEADRTPLVSYLASSANVGNRRLRALNRAGWLPNGEDIESLMAIRDQINTPSYDSRKFNEHRRETVISLEDMNHAGIDFRLHRTTATSLAKMLAGYDFSSFAALDAELSNWLLSAAEKLVVPLRGESSPADDQELAQPDVQPRADSDDKHDKSNGEPWRLRVFDAEHRPRCDLVFIDHDRASAYLAYAGVEYLRSGLRVEPIGHADRAVVVLPRLPTAVSTS